MGPIMQIVVRAVDQASKTVDGISGSVDRLGNKAQVASRKLIDKGQAMSRAGMAATRNLTLPLAGAALAVGKAGSEFETHMSRIVGLVGVSRDQVDVWSKELLTLGPQLGKSPRELAEALFFVTSAGFRGTEAIDVLTAAARAAAGGLGETKTVADAVTSAVNAYGSENLSATRATDILTAAVREGKLEASSLAPVLGRLLPTASDMGVSFEQVAGVLAVFSRTGAEAAEGATSLQAIMTTLNKPTAQTRKALESAGLSMGQLREVASGPGGLIEAMRLVESSFEGNDEALAQIFPNVRAFRGVMNALAQDAEIVDGVMGGVEDSTGAADDAFGAFSETAEFLRSQAMAELEGSLIRLSGKVLPILTTGFGLLATGVGAVVSVFEMLPGPLQSAVVGTLALAAAAGPAMFVVGKLTSGLGRLIGVAGKVGARLTRGLDPALRTIGRTSETASAGAGRARMSFRQMGRAAGGAAIGIGVATAAVMAHRKHQQETEQAINDAAQALLQGGDTAKRAEAQLKDLEGNGYGPLAIRAQEVRDRVKEMSDEMSSSEAVSQRLSAAQQAYADALADTNTPASELQAARRELTAAAREEEAIQSQVNDALEEGRDAVEGVADATDEFGAVADDTTDEISDLADALDDAFSSMFDVERATISYEDKLADLTGTLKENKGSTDLNTEAGRANREALIGMHDEALNVASAMLEQGASTDEVNDFLATHADRLETAAREAGLSEDAIAQLRDEAEKFPEEIKTRVEADTGEAEEALRRVQRTLDDITATVVTPTIRAFGGGQQQQHSGGVFHAPTPGGQGFALLRDREVVLTPGAQPSGGDREAALILRRIDRTLQRLEAQGAGRRDEDLLRDISESNEEVARKLDRRPVGLKGF